MTFPDSVAVYPEGPQPKSVDITPKTRFTWDPTSKCLGMETKTTPEDLAALAQSGVVDGVELLVIGPHDKKMTGLPALPAGVTSSLHTVKIDSAKLSDWEGVYALDGVRELVIGEKVSALPDGIAAMTALEHLTLGGKRLKELPADLTELGSLRSLKLLRCPVTALPETLGELPLEELALIGTKKLKALPESIGECRTLRVLRTQDVALKALPEGVYSLPALEKLSLTRSKLAKLGEAIDWPAMRELHLEASYKKWPKEVSMPALEQAVLGMKFKELPDLFVPSLRRIWVNAPLKSVDPRFAQLENRLESRERGAPMMGVKMSCSKAAFEALSDEEREAFAGRLKPTYD